MQSLKSGLLVAGSLGLLFLGACSSGSQTTSTNSSPTASPSAEASPADSSMKSTDHKMADGSKMSGEAMKGGQVVESGPYHLEFVPEKEADVTHLDLYVQKGDTHEAIPNAKVTAQVQLPDGSQKSLDMKYDDSEKHYTAKLPGAAAGEYKVAILSEINGEKVNARYSFKQ